MDQFFRVSYLCRMVSVHLIFISTGVNIVYVVVVNVFVIVAFMFLLLSF